MPAPPTTVVSVRLHEYDEALQVDKVRGIGFRGQCRCGWRGKTYRLRTTAAAELHWHKADYHDAEAG